MNSEKKHIFDDPKNIRRLLILFFIFLGFLLAAELFIHKHTAFNVERAPFFYAAYGFMAYVVLIRIAKFLRLLLMRKESYYEDQPTDGSPDNREIKNILHKD
jgi:hypothetical protein